MAITIEIKVVPSSGRQKFTIDAQGRIKCFLKSAPERGKANEELIKFLAKQLRVSQQSIEIVTGFTDRNKRVRIITTLTREAVFEVLGLGVQMSVLGGPLTPRGS